MFELTGRRALVGGSSQGIGRAIAEVFARQGASVTLLARDEAALRAVCAGLAKSGAQQHGVIVADFAQPDGLQRTVRDAGERVGGFDILVNNTGGPHAAAVLESSVDAFRRAFEMHVVCNQLLAQTLVPWMKERKWGRILQVISTSVKEPIPGLGVSNTTRWAVASWGKSLSRELAPFGITVNNILPGFTDTARLRELFETRAAREGRTVEQVAETARQAIPAARFARPEEIAAAAAFLASNEASYVTGVSLAVDGGRLGSM